MRTTETSLDLADTDGASDSTSKLALPQPSQQLVILAYVLVGSGLLVLCAVLMSLYDTFNNLAGNKLIAEFSKQAGARMLLTGTGSANVQLGEGGATLLALGVFVVFATIATFIGTALVRAGVQVASPQAQTAFTRLQQRVDTQFTWLRQRFEDVAKRWRD
ncbi:MAG TPA: hypothetical protein VGM54_10405 [Chthoniobacter sp.]|jgi:hypothetical protein